MQFVQVTCISQWGSTNNITIRPWLLFVVQAFGAKNYKMLGTVLQRAILIGWLACLPVSMLWLHIQPILLHLGQDPEIVAGASRQV